MSASLYSPAAAQQHSHLSPAGAVLAAAAFVALTFRRRRPLPVFAVILVLTLTALTVGQSAGLAGGALVMAAWTIAVARPRATSFLACALAAGALLIRGIAVDGTAGLRAENINVVVFVLLGGAIGFGVRERRAHLADLEDRADRAERGRETEAARRVAEERLRIARDLHDSLAHHMAVVNVQTGVAEHLLRSDPEAAATALGHARIAAGQVLGELGTVLGVLRSQTDGETTDPGPSLARIPELLEPMRAAGMEVRSTVVGVPVPLPSAVDQAAYRLVQEALTNVQKHAPGSRVRLAIKFTPGDLRVEVVNTAGSDPFVKPTHEAGFGLTGMQERCLAVGGHLVTGSTDGGGFQVLADLPIADGAAVALPR